MTSPDEESVAGASDDPGTQDTAPYITFPLNGQDVWNPVTIKGGGHARRNVRLVSPGSEDYLSDEQQMGGDGHFELTFRYPLKPGITRFQVLQWEMYPDSHLRSPIWTVYQREAPVIVVDYDGQMVGGTIQMKGRGAAAKSLVSARNSTGRLGGAQADDYGNFSFTVHLLSQIHPTVTMYVTWEIEGQLSRPSKEITVHRLSPVIQKPLENELVGNRPTFKGNGMEGSTIDLYSDQEGGSYGSATVINGFWQITLNRDIAEGAVRMTATAKLAGVEFSSVILINVIHPPFIKYPDSGSLVDSTFVVAGNQGIQTATVEILRDLGGHIVLGTATILQNTESWVVTLRDIPPGPLSLVAEQYIAGLVEHSRRSVARALKVRPAKIGDVKVEIADRSITFSGSAYPGATVVITVPGWSVTPPQPVVADGGKWEIKATGLPLGKYPASIVQKVVDGANGWIESLPYTFEVNNSFPDVYAVSSTQDYQPTFSGKGYTGATVKVMNSGDGSLAAPEVVVQGGEWRSRASQQWGPTKDQEVRIKQFLNGQESPAWVVHKVTIPPLQPGLNDPPEDSPSPEFSGTCWPGALVSVKFSDVDGDHKATVIDGNWTFTREQPFAADEPHTITVNQFVAQQHSPQVSKTFTIPSAVLQPVITQPTEGSEVGHDVTVMGSCGMKGAKMQLYSAQFDLPLGAAKELDGSGEWSIDLFNLDFDHYTIYAVQTLKGRPSARSESRAFEVVLMPPMIDQPTQHGTLPRTAKLEGTGLVDGYVEVFLAGVPEPLLTNIPVQRDGRWQGEVTLPVGRHTIWARQTFVDETGRRRESANTLLRQFSVVPVAPFIETPLNNDHVAKRVVVSGFGVPGDTITVQGDTPQCTVVQDDRTWSVTQDFSSLAAGPFVLEVVASLEGFTSSAAQRPVKLATFVPTIEAPAAGRRVSHPVKFAGRGRPGIGDVVSWYNPDVRWVRALPVAGDAWRGEATQPLPLAGSWYRFRQTLTEGEEGTTMSDWAESARFEVEPAPPPAEKS
ncbi:hypothetical protein PS718_00691 [Pseudomonas fluorescens]|uniref:Uncharacterized protein n=1 Tax=Pseudomonas fluorescens TaxID=294 RepID=A0A5E7A8H1_PSEFL|nr:hypothetical protein [Pseudomonas fluorescens]VVN75236.1 hypothetical protein PS718_00691 [Pseudomonas fluorescens]